MLQVTIYERPNGWQKVIDITNVYPDDEKWFKENNIVISMENDSEEGWYIVYGRREDEPEENEVIEFSHGRSCQDTLQALRKQLTSTSSDSTIDDIEYFVKRLRRDQTLEEFEKTAKQLQGLVDSLIVMTETRLKQ